MIWIDDFLGEISLPVPGEVYWVDTEILEGDDKKSRRPVLVVEVPSSPFGRITVVTRTSSVDRSPGVASAADPSLRFSTPGTWGYVRTADASLWAAPHVERLGEVDGTQLYEVIEEFGL